jgi:SAM-dependent methyltransferase
MAIATHPNKALWEKGDFTRIAESMRESGEALVASLGITPGLKILDVGCGDGTTAIPAARLGADVVGVDIASNLVAAGSARAQRAGLTNVRFQEGDAANLSEFADDSFDLVVSIFGAMFAHRPFDVASEMVRVTRPGGRIVMGNWIPNDPTLVAQILKTSSAYSPPPPEGFVSPMTWGVEDDVIERFARAGVPAENISHSRPRQRTAARTSSWPSSRSSSPHRTPIRAAKPRPSRPSSCAWRSSCEATARSAALTTKGPVSGAFPLAGARFKRRRHVAMPFQPRGSELSLHRRGPREWLSETEKEGFEPSRQGLPHLTP